MWYSYAVVYKSVRANVADITQADRLVDWYRVLETKTHQSSEVPQLLDTFCRLNWCALFRYCATCPGISVGLAAEVLSFIKQRGVGKARWDRYVHVCCMFFLLISLSCEHGAELRRC